jgi:hypothetical protein
MDNVQNSDSYINIYHRRIAIDLTLYFFVIFVNYSVVIS